MRGLLGQVEKLFSRWKAPFGCFCLWHSFLFVSDYGFGIEFAFWKKNSGENFLFRHRLKEKTRDSHSLLSQAAHNGVEVRGCSKLSESNPQLSSFLTEALGSRADGVSPVHVSSADRNPRLEAVCLEQRETPAPLALSWCSQRTVKTLLKPETSQGDVHNTRFAPICCSVRLKTQSTHLTYTNPANYTADLESNDFLGAWKRPGRRRNLTNLKKSC